MYLRTLFFLAIFPLFAMAQPQFTFPIHSMQLCNDGTVQVWGDNEFGQLGNGTYTDNLVPTSVPGLEDIVMVAQGNYHNLALTCDGNVWAWGMNKHGQLGVGSSADFINTPQLLPELTGVIKIVAGNYASGALLATGEILMWGDGNSGQLGNGSNSSSNVPVLVTGIDNAVDLSISGLHAMTILDDGTLVGWGRNFEGQLGLGLGTAGDYNLPVPVPGLANVILADLGYDHSVVVLYDGSLWTFGGTFYGQLGNGASGSAGTLEWSPVQISGVSNIIDVEAGFGFTLLLTSDGDIFGTGQGLALGVCPDVNSAVFIPGPDIDDVVDLIVNPIALPTIVALLEDGTTATWGDNSVGLLGTGSNIPSSSCDPVYPDICPALVDDTCIACDFGEIYHFGETYTSGIIVDGEEVNWTNGNNQIGAITNFAGIPKINCDIIVKSGTNLKIEDMTLSFATKGRIMVEPGAILTLKGGVRLVSATECMWQGIRVLGNGTCGFGNGQTLADAGKFYSINGAPITANLIQDAIIGIATFDPGFLDVDDLSTVDFDQLAATNTSNILITNVFSANSVSSSGGYILCFNTEFIDCFVGAQTFCNTAYESADIAECLFETKQSLKFPFIGRRGEAGVHGMNYQYMALRGNTYRDLEFGVYSNTNRLQLGISNSRFENCDVGVSSQNIFNAVSNYVYTGNSGDGPNAFLGCRIGAQYEGSDVTFLENSIQQNFANPNPDLRLGVYYGGCDIDMSKNRITDTQIGIQMDDNTNWMGLVYLNNFFTNDIPVVSRGYNGDQQSGVLVHCNELVDYAISGWLNTNLNSVPGDLTDQGDCNPLNPPLSDPVFNRFFAAPGAPLPDLFSVSTGMFNYVPFDGTVADDWIPTAGAWPGGFNVPVVDACSGQPPNGKQCKEEEGFIGDENEYGEEEIKTKNLLLADQINNFQKAGDFEGALSLLEMVTTDVAHKKLATEYILKGQHTKANNCFPTIPTTTIEDQHFYDFHALLNDLEQQPEGIYSLSGAEKDLVVSIANSDSKTAFNARALLYLLDGTYYPAEIEEWEVYVETEDPLPPPTKKWDGENSLEVEGSIQLYPNPSSGKVRLEYQLNAATPFHIYDLTGQLVFETVLDSKGSTYVIEQGLLSKGVYFYRVGTEESGKLIIQ